jgi:hypothetical protein
VKHCRLHLMRWFPSITSITQRSWLILREPPVVAPSSRRHRLINCRCTPHRSSSISLKELFKELFRKKFAKISNLKVQGIFGHYELFRKKFAKISKLKVQGIFGHYELFRKKFAKISKLKVQGIFGHFFLKSAKC